MKHNRASDETLLEHASAIAFQRLDEVDGDIAKLAEPFQIVALIYSAQGVIDNGGLIYFFESDWPANPPYSLFVDAYRRIGRIAAADALDQAAKSFGVPFPERDSDLRNRFMENEGTDEWDDCICGDEDVWRDLANWIRSNGIEHFRY